MVILQNQWFKDPARMRGILEKHYSGRRNEFIRTFLFWSCRTGKNLKAAFGEELCDQIIWEEASPEIGGAASSAFPADPMHINNAICKHCPDIVVALGKIASEGVKRAFASFELNPRLIIGPHPTARHATVMDELREVGRTLTGVLGILSDGIEILNKYTIGEAPPPEAVSVMRGTPLGNPYSHMEHARAIRVATREEAVELYLPWLRKQYAKGCGPAYDELMRLADIYRRDGRLLLLCCCSPKLCHATHIKNAILGITKSKTGASHVQATSGR
jgi:hypothetical protein